MQEMYNKEGPSIILPYHSYIAMEAGNKETMQQERTSIQTCLLRTINRPTPHDTTLRAPAGSQKPKNGEQKKKNIHNKRKKRNILDVSHVT